MTRFKPLDQTTDPCLIEPQGLNPFLVFLDNSVEDEKPPPLLDQYGIVIDDPQPQPTEPIVPKEWDPERPLME